MRKSMALLGLSLILGLAVQAADPSLYKRLGGKKVIRALVDDFIGRAASDSRLSQYFVGSTADRERLGGLKRTLVHQICRAAGGPCEFRQAELATAPVDVDVPAEAERAFAEHFDAMLDKFKIDGLERKQLSGMLGPILSEIART